MCDTNLQRVNDSSAVSHIIFTNCHLNGQDFSNKTFKRSKFNKTHLSEINFKSVFLDDVDFTEAKLVNVDFSNISEFTDVKFTDADFQYCNFDECAFKKVDFIRATWISDPDIVFSSVSLEDVDFTDAKFTGITFDDAIIQNTTFKNATFENTDFSLGEFIGINFTGANFTGATFDNCIFRDVDFIRVDFTGANFTGTTTFEECIFRDVDYTEAELSRADFKNTELTRAVFTDSVLTSAIFTGAKFSRAIFIRAILTGADFTRADFTRAVFTGAIFTGANLTGADFTGANLTGADFTGANLTGADFTGANLTDVIGMNIHSPTPPNYVHLSPSFKQIPLNQIATDIIEGEVEMTEFLTENTNSVVFFFQNNYYLVDKNELSKTIKTHSRTDKEDNSIVYKCKIVDTMNPEKIVLNKPLVKLGSVGIPVNYSYIPIQYIKNVVDNTSKKVKDRMYEIVKTTETVKTVVSYQVLHNIIRQGEDRNTLYVGASHCQKGQGGELYKLRKIKNAGRMVSDVIKRVATIKNNARTAQTLSRRKKEVGSGRKTKKLIRIHS